ncbi:hypothetical protein [Sorangium sp. So ce861]|uniref:hypothetical protein n=1 Tax=Sorangium sp. So ce861 TaxID=3133323 RepID=UPI003F61B2F1
MLVLIEGGEVLAPEPIGAAAVLLAGDRILKVGPVDLEQSNRKVELHGRKHKGR